MSRYSLLVTNGTEQWAVADSEYPEDLREHARRLLKASLRPGIEVVGVWDRDHSVWVEENGL
jgi:hypothetical protein